MGPCRPCPSHGKPPHLYNPYADCSLHKAAARTQHVEMGTVALVQGRCQDDALGPSDEHLWAPLALRNVGVPPPLV